MKLSIYNQIIEFLTQECIKNHADLTGIILVGSFSVNQGDILSDIDVDFVYHNKNYMPVKLPENKWEWDIQEHLLDSYPGISHDHWNCGTYVTANVLLDKTNVIKAKINELINPGFEYFKDGLGNVLDSYYNAYYRSMKCLRRNNLLGAHIMACNSMEALNVMLYQVNGLLQTYINRLPATIHRLKILPLPANELLDCATNIATKADAQSQIKAYLAVKDMMNRLGYIQIYEAWEGKLDKEIELIK